MTAYSGESRAAVRLRRRAGLQNIKAIDRVARRLRI
jgi:hypothetical protein